ncbi:MAG: flavin reductase [Elusimicrobia bacterium]|nr:flavin reductase [Elusimicrobiota bacterium]
MRKIEYATDKKKWAPSLIPGPLALISTINRAKEPNVAPKSWLQMASFEPPILMFSGSKGNTTEKNLLATGCFAVNLVDSTMAAKAFSCIEWFGLERIEKMGITLSQARKISAPLIDQCPAHLECAIRETHEVGGGFIVYGEIVAASIREDILGAAPADRYRLLDQIVFLEDDLCARVRDPYPARRSAEGPASRKWTRYVISLTRTDKPMTGAAVRRHVAHLKKLDRQGRLELCGPFKDGKGGMAIIRAGSLEEAKAIAESDPFIKEGLETYALREWELSCEENNHMGMG